LVLHGPNLNLLGTRRPELYGTATLAAIDESLVQRAQRAGVRVVCFQSNHEGALIDRIHAARGNFDAILINAGAYSHTSLALRDALESVAIPAIEVHLTNVHAREPLRRHSMLAEVCIGVVAGFGARSYTLALDAAMAHLAESRP
jgi:3-dehydroquinate dehydratase-2